MVFSKQKSAPLLTAAEGFTCANVNTTRIVHAERALAAECSPTLLLLNVPLQSSCRIVVWSSR